MGSIENTAAEGQTAAHSFIGGKSALLCNVAPNPGLLTPSAAYTFSWTGYLGAGNEGNRIKRYRWEIIASDIVEIEMAFDTKLVASGTRVLLHHRDCVGERRLYGLSHLAEVRPFGSIPRHRALARAQRRPHETGGGDAASSGEPGPARLYMRLLRQLYELRKITMVEPSAQTQTNIGRRNPPMGAQKVKGKFAAPSAVAGRRDLRYADVCCRTRTSRLSARRRKRWCRAGHRQGAGVPVGGRDAEGRAPTY